MDPEYLEPWKPGALGLHLDLEDAIIDATVDLVGVKRSGASIARSQLLGVPMAGSQLRALRLVDVELRDVDGANSDWRSAKLSRIVFEGCRLTGLTAIEMEATDVVFRDCKLNLANFSHSTLQRVVFEGCVLDEAYFSGSKLNSVRFDGSQLRRTRFDAVEISDVDFRGSELMPDGDVLVLRESIIDSLQLISLAPLLARDAGITVSDEDPEDEPPPARGGAQRP